MYDASMVIPADARAMGATTALRRGYNGKPPRMRYSDSTRQEGTSPNVLVTYADGTQQIKSAYSFKPKNRAPRAATAAQQQRHSIMSWDLPAIGNND